MISRSSHRPPPPEHGDWHAPSLTPAEDEHLQTMDIFSYSTDRARTLLEYPRPCPASAPAKEQKEGEHERPLGSRIFRIAVACLVLLPLELIMVYALLLQLYRAGDTVSQRSFWLEVPVWYTLLGVGTFITLNISRIVTPILMFIYVLGHELTHAITAKMSLAKVQRMCVDINGGYVETTADNLFVALSPYFVPLWMLLWLGALWVINYFAPFPEWEAWFYAGFGFWWSFHLYWTIWVIPREQPDMRENGVFFSLMLIVIMNILVLLVILWCFGLTSPAGYGRDFLVAARDIAHALVACWQRFYALCQ